MKVEKCPGCNRLPGKWKGQMNCETGSDCKIDLVVFADRYLVVAWNAACRALRKKVKR
jgi:hypothetical protein